MIDAKQLKELSDFPGYFASRDGDIYSTRQGEMTLLSKTYDRYGYARLKVYFQGKPKTQLVSRLVASAFFSQNLDGVEVDHIDGDKANNSVDNLRVLTRAENARGFRGTRGSDSSEYRGVHWDDQVKKWRTSINHLGRRLTVGDFKNEREAALAYNEAAEKYGYLPEALNVL